MSLASEMKKTSTNKVSELFCSGDLKEALFQALEQVKLQPEDEFSRVQLVELLCVNGEYERADNQLNTLMTLKPELSLTLAIWRQLIFSAQMREDVFALKAKPELIGEPTESIANALEMLIAIKDKDSARVATLLEESNTAADKNVFILNDQKSAIIRDLDDVTANLLEVMGTNGKYFWIDFSQIVEVKIDKPTRIIELLWRKAKLISTSGSEGEVYIPAIYPVKDDEAAALGRKTEWLEQNGLYRGIGLRAWLFGDDELSINEYGAINLKNTIHN